MAHLTRTTTLGPGREFDLIRAMLEIWGPMAAGIGDDAAIVEVPAGQQLVVSTDSSVEDVHFRRRWLAPEEIGYRATQAALSDLAAMAASPLGFVVALTLPRAWHAELPALASGIGQAAHETGATIRGGDLTSGSSLSITVTVLGAASAPLGRAGAQPMDQLYVTGALSGPLRAVRAWERGTPPSAWCRDRFARPRARLREARWLAARGAHAMIDISDGLASELEHLASAGRFELRVDVDRIPCGDGGSWREALESGEEYELLVAMPREVDVDAFARTFGIPITAIGHVRQAESAMVVATHGGVRVDLARGHDHFST
ncbi:MAG: thiamine-phosphate kinase [Gemmatimonadaceae bacterium]|nr:thiamine-phosphate kinase [Gemmatimonadaceae bacterium]